MAQLNGLGLGWREQSARDMMDVERWVSGQRWGIEAGVFLEAAGNGLPGSL